MPHLYAPPDGWLDLDGVFHAEEPDGENTPVYVVELRPDDGLYPLPYMARQADGSPWEDTGTSPYAPAERNRQTFYPDARRLYEEIERFGIVDLGVDVALGAIADFDFFRAAPSGATPPALCQSASARTSSATTPTTFKASRAWRTWPRRPIMYKQS